MEIKNIKLLGGIGIGLTLFSWIPVVGFLFAVIGSILMIIAFWKISKINSEQGIFKNFLLGYIFSFLGGFVLGVFSHVSYNYYPNSLISIALWIIFSGFTALSGYFFKKALDKTGEILNENLFKAAGKLIFFGSLGTIIVLGIFVVFIGWIIATVAFFRLPDTLKQNL